MSQPDVVLTREDFKNAKASLKSLRKLRPKFVALERSVLKNLPQKFNQMKRQGHHFVSRPNRRGGGYWSEIWLGMSAHPPPVYNGLMFQFGIWNRGVFSCGLWLQGGYATSRARNTAWSAISGSSVRFIDLLSGLGKEYYLEFPNTDQFRKPIDRISNEDIDEILDILRSPDSFLNVSKRLSMSTVIESKERIAAVVATVFRDLYPLYSFLTGPNRSILSRKVHPPDPIKILRSSIWAQNIVIEAEKRHGRKVRDVSDQPVGYDLESKGRKGRTRLIEVKSRKIEGRLQLTPNEYVSASKFGPQYYIYVVRSKNNIQVIRDPILSCEMTKVPQYVWEVRDWTQKGRKYS